MSDQRLASRFPNDLRRLAGAENETAGEGVGALTGGENKIGDKTFLMAEYRPEVTFRASIPSVEYSGRFARVVCRGGRLFAVGAYALPEV